VARIRLHIHIDDDHSLGPGKISLLESVREHGSISGAARALGMAYRHAWELIDDLNESFDEPVVEATSGGRRGGGARVTPFGEALIRRYRAMERATRRIVARELEALGRGAPAARPRASRRRRTSVAPDSRRR
jgi:molybdate transport system regulatory protein